MLVSYSDSEGSDDEQPKPQSQKPASKTAPSTSNSNFAIDKSSGKIKVNLQNKPDPTANGTHEDEPAAKRPRLGAGGGAFSNFNAMLPAPKRDNLPPAQNGVNKAPARKVFSLRTGAEPAFSRESDAELKELFAEQNTSNEGEGMKPNTSIPSTVPKPAFAKPAPPAPAGKPMMFKPLSVSRITKKKKPPLGSTTSTKIPALPPSQTQQPPPSQTQEAPKKKINLFSAGTDANIDTTPHSTEFENDDSEDEIIEDLGPAAPPPDTNPQSGPQSLDTIANDLNLTAAERRQLFGRGSNTSSTTSAINVVNFNTDAEYAANQALIAAGETVQHNPVRAIASGKHSLRQLVSSAATQKEALEESFATGRRNKKEAGNKYGW